MNDEELVKVGIRGSEIIRDLMKIIPDWQKVDLTKKGYNAQYVHTIIDTAMYVVEREKKVIEELND